MLGVTVGSIVVHIVLTLIFKNVAKRTVWDLDDDLVKYLKRPTFIIFPVVSLLITIQLVTLPQGVKETVQHALVIILLFSVSYFVVMIIKCGALAIGRINSHIRETEPKRAREVDTQIVVMTRIIQGMVWVLGLAGIAMTFPNAWQVGVSLLASASVATLLLGFAAKPSIEMFQNWSRAATRHLVRCQINIDARTVSIAGVRKAFAKFAKKHPAHDGHNATVLVSDWSMGGSVQLTCQMTVRNSCEMTKVECEIREALLEYVLTKTGGWPLAETKEVDDEEESGDISASSVPKNNTPAFNPLAPAAIVTDFHNRLNATGATPGMSEATLEKEV
ncbi:hypothetical protein BGW42_006140 [Actinomortierella wolfii]|nr:hypothetical protein BGW42_006140 [Actinomortierella wolfii]